MKSTGRFYLSLLYIGVMAGVIGAALTWLLHHLQHYAFGYGLSGESLSFRQGVEQSEAWRRWAVLTLCGLIAGAGWFAIHRNGVKFFLLELTRGSTALLMPMSLAMGGGDVK